MIKLKKLLTEEECPCIVLEMNLKQKLATGALGLASMLPMSAGHLDPMELYNQIAHHEGVKGSVYKDSKGHPTIGVGFNLDSKHNVSFLKDIGLDRNELLQGKKITLKQAKLMYNHSLKQAYKDVVDLVPNFKTLPKDAKKVLLDMSFNLGKTKLAKFKNMRDALEKRDFNTAANEMMDSAWYKQVKGRGVTLVDMMRNVK